MFDACVRSSFWEYMAAEWENRAEFGPECENRATDCVSIKRAFESNPDGSSKDFDIAEFSCSSGLVPAEVLSNRRMLNKVSTSASNWLPVTVHGISDFNPDAGTVCSSHPKASMLCNHPVEAPIQGDPCIDAEVAELVLIGSHRCRKALSPPTPRRTTSLSGYHHAHIAMDENDDDATPPPTPTPVLPSQSAAFWTAAAAAEAAAAVKAAEAAATAAAAAAAVDGVYFEDHQGCKLPRGGSEGPVGRADLQSANTAGGKEPPITAAVMVASASGVLASVPDGAGSWPLLQTVLSLAPDRRCLANLGGDSFAAQMLRSMLASPTK